VDPYVGPAQVLASDVDVTLCLLSADPAVLRERILARGWDEQDVDEAVAENAALREAGFIDVTLEAADLRGSDGQSASAARPGRRAAH
jgi:predicted kinase